MKRKLLVLSILTFIILGITACSNTDMPAERTEEELADFSGEFFVEIPAEFEKTEEADGAKYYLHKDHPEKESNICVSFSENDDSFKFLSANRYVKQIAKGLKNAYGKKVTSKIIEEKYLEISGRRVFMYQAQYEVDDQKIIQIHYVIEDKDQIIAVTFTERNDEGFLETFKQAAESISFLPTK